MMTNQEITPNKQEGSQQHEPAKNLLKINSSHLGHDEFVRFFDNPDSLSEFINDLSNNSSFLETKTLKA